MTDRLNAIGGVMALLVLVDIVIHRPFLSRGWRWARCLSGAVFVLGLALLVVWHDRMDALLDVERFSRPDRKVFKPRHQQYMLTMTFMWLACVFELGAMMHGHRCRAMHEAAGNTHEKPAA